MHYLKTLVFLSSLLSLGFVLWRQLLTPEARGWVNIRFASAIPIIAVGLYAPSLWIYYSAILGAMLFLPRSRVEAAGLFIVLSFALPFIDYDLYVGTAFIMRLKGHMIASLGLVPAFRFRASAGSPNAGSGRITAAVCLFIAMQIVLDSRLADVGLTTAGRNIIMELVALGVPYALVAHSINGESDTRRPLFYLMTVGFFLSIIAVFEMLRHWPLYQTIDSNLGTAGGLSKTLAMRGGLLRAPGSFSESTAFGVFLAVTTVCMASVRSVFRLPAMQYAAVGIGLLGCFATLSRNAWIGAVLGLVIVSLFRGRVGKAMVACVLSTVMGLILILASPDSGALASLLGKGTTTAASTATYRQDLFSHSMPLIRSSPWIGTPYYRVAEFMRPEMRSGKLSVDYVNTYLFYAVAAGIIGLSIYCIFVFYPILRLLSSRKRLMVNSLNFEAAGAVFASQVALAAMLVGTSFSERLPLLTILLIGISRSVLAHAGRRLAAGPAEPTRKMPTGFVIVDPMHPKLLSSDRR